MKRHPLTLSLLLVFGLIGAPLPSNPSRPKNAVPSLVPSHGTLLERVARASFLSGRDRRPVLPRAGSAQSSSDAAAIEAIYTETQAEYDGLPVTSDLNVKRRQVEHRLLLRLEAFGRQSAIGLGAEPPTRSRIATPCLWGVFVVCSPLGLVHSQQDTSEPS